MQDMVKEFGRVLKFIEGSGCHFGFYSKSNGNSKNFKKEDNMMSLTLKISFGCKCIAGRPEWKQGDQLRGNHNSPGL